MKKVAEALAANTDAYRMDDSFDMLGGLRNLVIQLFYKVRGFVSIAVDKDSNIEDCNALFGALELYVGTGLPIMATMEKLNHVCHAVSDSKMRGYMEHGLFSENIVECVDSMNALITHTQNGGNVQKNYQQIIHYCATDVTEMTAKYIDCLAATE